MSEASSASVARAAAFQKAFQNLQLQPLVADQDWKNFGVSYNDRCLAELEQLVEDSTEPDNQFIFAGHRGCGKSTVLAEFAKMMSDRYFTVFFSIADLIESYSINHINILFTMAVQLMAKAESEKIAISPSKIKAFRNWFKTRTHIEEASVSGEAEVGFDLFGLLKTKLKTDAKMREEIKTEFTKDLRDLIDTINNIATEIQLASGRKILAVIDDLDKLELTQIDEIFYRNLKALLEPNFTVIYTIPIATIRDTRLKSHLETETSTSIYVMPVLKLFAKHDSHRADGQPVPEKFKTLLQILHRRVAPDLLAEGVAEKIVLYSGGVNRELIRIAKECCRLMRVELRVRQRRGKDISQTQIDQSILQEALDSLRNEMSITLGKTDREILEQIYCNYQPDDPKAEAFLEMLHGVYVIEYRNKESWYDVHPLLIDQLRIEQRIG
ncbi:MAG: AAA family ATPase [Limnothrix sp. CACIAM 69d]|nr:MAG: AAA family ATPase [Limnothrix sp. CACIAM 69d]